MPASHAPSRSTAEIRTARLVLRLPDHGDAAAIADYNARNRAFHAPWMPRRGDAVFSPGHWEERIPVMRADHLERGSALVLFMREQGRPDLILGKVAYSQIARGPAQFCYLGYDLDESAQGRGYMAEALKGANEYVFGVLGLHRIMANYMPRNERSARVLRRLGFTVEGYARDYLLIDGRWEDHILASLTNPTWGQSP